MELLDLEKIANKEKINLINCKMRKNKARIIESGETYIFMDYSAINTQTEEKCLLAEELRALLLFRILYHCFRPRNY